MQEVDARFKAQRLQAMQRRSRQRRRRLSSVGGAAALVLLGGAGFLSYPHWIGFFFAPSKQEAQDAAPEPPPQIAPFVPALLDLPGNPLTISLGGSSGGGAVPVKPVPRPEGLMEPGIPPTLEVFSDKMLASSERFMITLPSSAEDFAFFQAQSGRLGTERAGSSEVADAGPTAPADDAGEDTSADADEVLVPVASQDDQSVAAPSPDAAGLAGGDGDAAALDSDDGEDAPLPASGSAPAADTPTGTGEEDLQGPEQDAGPQIEDTTSVVNIVGDAERFRPDEDIFIRTSADQSLGRALTDNGFSPGDAAAASAAVKAAAAEGLDPEHIPAGYVVAMRGHKEARTEAHPRLAQLTIYRSGTLVATVALVDDGSYAAGADPWAGEDLPFYSTGDQQAAAPKREYRLLDAIYSAATRAAVPASVVGEAIMLMSRTFDLQSFATADDRLVLIYSDDPRDRPRNSGRVLYAAIRSPSRTLECFAYQAQPGADFSCLTEKDQIAQAGQAGTATVSNGMVTPVKGGTMTSRFGPRMHPILHRVIVHEGVDWAAPVGTPIMAAFAGTVSFVGGKTGFGNYVRIEHGSGRATGYAHMSRFADGLASGKVVAAGDIIGYVGTTGRSTGPHLHFELYVNNQPVDPLGAVPTPVPSGPAAATVAVKSDDSAVEKLTNIIVHVESGGNARAKNPLSSATGLGQFIESTWIRMMQTYRPELVKSMSRAALLELRYDPTVSREMVSNLAREGESYLRARGHAITAGRLYLAHFLGMEGANTVLSASGGSLVVDVMGAGVIKANPFLTGKDCNYVIAWAERKMSGKAPPPSASTPTTPSGGVVATAVFRPSPEFLKFKDLIGKLAAGV